MISQWEIEDSEGQVVSIFGVSKDKSFVLAKLSDNRLINVPIYLLQIKNSQRYYFPKKFNDLEEISSDLLTFPVIEEKPVINKKIIDTAEINIKKSVSEHPEIVECTLAKEEFQVERIPIHEVREEREEPAQIRIEGDDTFIPVQEEILVVQKKILVKEELRIRKIRTEHNEKVTVNLRKEEVTVERKKFN